MPNLRGQTFSLSINPGMPGTNLTRALWFRSAHAAESDQATNKCDRGQGRDDSANRQPTAQNCAARYG